MSEQRTHPSAILDFMRKCDAPLIERDVDQGDMDTLLEYLWPRDRTKHPTTEERERASNDIRAIATLYVPPAPTPSDPQFQQRLKSNKKLLEAADYRFAKMTNYPGADLLIGVEIGRHLDAAKRLANGLAGAQPRGPKTIRLPVECIFLLGDVYRETTGKNPALSKNRDDGFTPFVRFVHHFGQMFGWTRSEDQVSRDIERAFKVDPKRKNG